MLQALTGSRLTDSGVTSRKKTSCLNGSAGWWAPECDGAFPCGVPCNHRGRSGQEGSCLKYSYLQRILGPNPLGDAHIADGQADAQRPEVTPRLPREYVLGPGFEPGLGFWKSRAHTCSAGPRLTPRKRPLTCRPRVPMWNGRLGPSRSSVLKLSPRKERP